MKQLYFLLFIGAMYLIGWWWQGGFSTESEGPAIVKVENSFRQDFRQRPYRLSALATCQQGCRSVSDSSLALILQYGVIERQVQDTIILRGRSLQGHDIWLLLTQGDTNTIFRLSAPLSSFHCNCPTPDQGGE